MACANHYSRCHVAIGNASLSLVATIELQSYLMGRQPFMIDHICNSNKHNKTI